MIPHHKPELKKPEAHSGNDEQPSDDPSHDKEPTNPIHGTNPDPTTQGESGHEEVDKQDEQDRLNKSTDQINDQIMHLISEAFDPDQPHDTQGDEPGPHELDPSGPQKLPFFDKALEPAHDIWTNYCDGDLDPFVKIALSNSVKVKSISAEKLSEIIQGHKHEEAFSVLDLRDPTSPADGYCNQTIPGAKSFPVKETNGGVEWGPAPKNQERWEKELANPNSPIHELTKPLIIVHCRQSQQRTPMFVAGYLKYVVPQSNQRIIILKGGFNEYEKQYTLVSHNT